METICLFYFQYLKQRTKHVCCAKMGPLIGSIANILIQKRNKNNISNQWKCPCSELKKQTLIVSKIRNFCWKWLANITLCKRRTYIMQIVAYLHNFPHTAPPNLDYCAFDSSTIGIVSIYKKRSACLYTPGFLRNYPTAFMRDCVYG